MKDVVFFFHEINFFKYILFKIIPEVCVNAFIYPQCALRKQFYSNPYKYIYINELEFLKAASAFYIRSHKRLIECAVLGVLKKACSI